MTDRERRVVAVGIAITALAIVVKMAPPKFRALEEMRAETSEVVRLAARAQGIVSAIPTMRDSLSVRTAAMLSLAPLMVGSGTHAEAVATFGTTLQRWAAGYDVTIGRMESGRDSVTTGFTRLILELEVESDLEGLVLFVGRIERDPQLLSIERLSVENGNPTGDAQSLRSTLLVSGWIPGGGP